MEKDKILIVGHHMTTTAQVLAERLAKEHSAEVILVESNDIGKTILPLNILEGQVPRERLTNESMLYNMVPTIHDNLLGLPPGNKRGIKINVHTTPKIGRNSPCPCGSGIKAKKCKCTKR